MDHSADFARQFDAGPIAKTKTADVFVKFLLAHAHRELGCADVARFHQYIAHVSSPYAL